MRKTSEQAIATGRSRKLKVLFAGEQVSAIGHEIKGFDSFEVSANKEDGWALFEALKSGGHDVDWMRTNQVAVEFPERLADLRRYSVCGRTARGEPPPSAPTARRTGDPWPGSSGRDTGRFGTNWCPGSVTPDVHRKIDITCYA